MCSTNVPSQPQSNSFNPQPPIQQSNPTHIMNNPLYMNVANGYPIPFQNIHMGLLPQAQFFPHVQNTMQNPNQNMSCQPHGHFFANNQGTKFPGGQFNVQHLPQNFHQISSLPHGQFPQHYIGLPQVNPFNMLQCLPQSMRSTSQGTQTQVPQSLGFNMNPQIGMSPHQITHNGQCQSMFIPSTMGQNVMHGSPITGQQLQRNLLPSLHNDPAQMQQAQINLQSDQFGTSQGNHPKKNGSNISNSNQNNSQGNDFARNQEGSVNRNSQNTRFQKSNFHSKANGKGNFKPFKGKGYIDKGARNPHLTKCTEQKSTADCQSSRSLSLNYSEQEIQKWREERRKNHPSSSKPLVLNYTEQEIKKWREERKKNHPSRPNIENSEDEAHSKDISARNRRQQLKEILAKQAELGVEVAEIPRDYLLELESKLNENEQDRTSSKKEKFQKRGGKRQKRGRYNKKQKLEDSESFPRPAMNKKNLSLLEKLLSADIKRDKSHLLQTFRFMVLNNFFVEWPKKCLEFPSVTVEDSGPGRVSSLCQGNQVVYEIAKTGNVEDLEQDTSHEDIAGGNDAENEDITDEYVKQTDSITEGNLEEEGEITD
ncbi:Gata zinc finger protein [Thalictrum thalictroides]|uniref:Gata zinc finger protein n=1 Tax=Thalictrum thalictroides TaxID=46969 RepID=A0A7J6XGK3_THATH|nr:Gata zinc finger protein [Thalictrum thalictroides]